MVSEECLRFVIGTFGFDSSFELRHSTFLKGPMIYLYATLLLLTNTVAWMANVFMLPGNWVLVGFAALYALVLPEDAQPRVSWIDLPHEFRTLGSHS
ncbi:MAG: hypothetical protein ACKVT0_21770 [Planctomycetaceae bacterium]